MKTIYRVGEGARPAPLAMEGVARELERGALALLPTETVYGVGVAVAPFAGDDAARAEMPPEGSGYRRIFSLKRRALTQTVAWLVDGPDALTTYGVDVPDGALALAEKLWPGALTIVVRASDKVPPFMRAADGTVALRQSASPVIAELVRRCGPLAVTSANTHGMPAATEFSQVEPVILDGVDIAVDAGPAPARDASTIVSLMAGELAVLREGALPAQAVRDVLDAAPNSVRG